MRELKKIVLSRNFNGNLGKLMAENKTTLWSRVDEDIEGGFKLDRAEYQFINYRNMALRPIVNDIVKGNVNGRTSAELLWNTFKDDRESTNDRKQIEWWLKTITLGQVTSSPGGMCFYSPEHRLLILNESRDNWQRNQNGERDRMFIIGNCCEEQGIIYRYLPKAAADESTVLILALPNPKGVVEALKAQKEGRKVVPIEDKKTTEETSIERQISDVMDHAVEEHSLPTQVAPTMPEKIVTTTVRRGIVRKGVKEIDIKKLEENFQSDDE